jgi:GTP-binding protein
MLDIRNVAIIAHVDHGKTTLVDEILKQSNFFREGEQVDECFLDKNDLERERGITILAKNIAITYRNTKINLIDTPGHSDFGGQVERVLKLADGVLLLVDAAEGPMPQTRFVLDKALTLGLKPVVIINKVDKPMARVEEVHEKIFDLFVELNASHDQLDFPLLYASGRDGWATDDPDGPRSCILPVLDAILSSIPPPPMHEGPVQMQVATLDHSDYLGRIGVGRVYRGSLKKDSRLALLRQRGGETVCAVKQLFTFRGLERVPIDAVQCGDLCAVAGIEELDIGDTLADADAPEALPPISVDEPTMSMVVRVNDSPFYGRESTYSSSRHIRARLFKEAERDVALQVEEMDGDSYQVSGRGILHFSILMENMRREGYEMTVSQPHVIFKNVNGKVHEPLETLSIDVPEESAGRVIELVGMRRGEMTHMEKHGNRQLLDFEIPSRGLIGLRTKVTTASQGEAIMSHRFLRYAEHKGDIPQRTNGVLISMDQGKAVAYAADGLQSRGTLFVGPGDVTYEGMISGEHCKEGDLVVNLQKGKQLTNVRAAGSDRNMQIAPPRRMSLEEALEFIADDELVEVTPESIRLRKRLLTEAERRRQRRSAAKS